MYAATHKQIISDRYVDRQRLQEKLSALFPPHANDIKLQWKLNKWIITGAPRDLKETELDELTL